MITIREATAADARLIGRVMTMALGPELAVNYCGKQYLKVAEALALAPDTQYSHRNSLVAEVDGTPAGGIIAYDGAQLAELRAASLALIKVHTGACPVPGTDETQSGEVYIDSLAVLPEFRGHGVASALIDAVCERSFAAGHDRVGLLVDDDNPAARRLYESLGFRQSDVRVFLGHRMAHMVRSAH